MQRTRRQRKNRVEPPPSLSLSRFDSCSADVSVCLPLLSYPLSFLSISYSCNPVNWCKCLQSLSCSSQSCSDWTGSEVLIGFEVSISFLGSLFCSFHYYTPLIWVYVHAYNLFIYTWQWYFSSFSRLKSLLHIVGLDMLSHIIHGFLIFPLCSLHREARRGLEECSFMSICCRWGISLNTSGQGSTELV